MKKIFVGLIAFISAFVFSNVEVRANEYNGTLGYQYMSNGVMFNYYTDRNDVNLYVEIDGVNEIKTQQLEKIANGSGYSGYVGFDENVVAGSSYRIKMCDISDENDCEYILDAFSYHLNENSSKNAILDTGEIDASWGNVTRYPTSEYKRSIYALDAKGFTKNIEALDANSVFEKMVVSASKGDSSVGVNYLKSLGFSHLEISTLYDSNNYFAINGEYSNGDNVYSSLKEYQYMLLELKKYNLNIVMRTNFTNVGEELEKSLLAMSTSSVIDHRLNYNDPIVQRYITEVYKYWASKYHVDGFYIEDSQLYPADYLSSLISSVKSLNGGLFIYSNSDASGYKTSDSLQNLLVGSLDSLDSKGIVNGYYTKENMSNLVDAMFSGYYQDKTGHKNANKTINNFGSLKGLDIYSKISATVNISNAVLNKYKLALYTIFASSGTPRIVAGNEFMNTTIVENDPLILNKICITSSICYAMGEDKSIDWTYLNRHGNLSSIAYNYRSAYYYQYPSSYSLENARSIKIDENSLEKGVLFITFNYDGVQHGDIERSLFVVNYGKEAVKLNKISQKQYTLTSPIIGKISETDENKTEIAGETFYVYTEVKIINIPQWAYLVIGIGLIGVIVGFRQFLIYSLKKRRGIDYTEFKTEQKESKKKEKRKKIVSSNEPSIFEIFVADDPLVKERREVAKKSREARKQKKIEKQQENKEKENDGK